MAKDLETLILNIEARTGKLEAQLKQVETQGVNTANKIGAGFSGAGKAIFAAVSFAAISRFFKYSLQAYSEEQDAIAELTAQLGYRNQALIDYASQIQKTTRYGDESVIQAQAQLAAFTKDEEQIKLLTKATVDLAAAKKMDLVSAADLVAKSFGGPINALSRYGIEAKGAAGSTEKLNGIVENTARLFGGVAEAQAKTLAGRWEQLKNRAGDMQERIGGALVPTLEKLMNIMNDTVAEGEKMDDFFKGIAVGARILGSVFLVVKTALVHIGTLLGTVGAALYASITGQFQLMPDIIKNGYGKIKDNSFELIEGIKDMWSNLDEEVEKDTIRTNSTVTGSTEEAAKKRIELEGKLYEELKFKSANYLKERLKQINTEVEEMRKAGLNAVDVEKYKFEQLKKLAQEATGFGYPKTKNFDIGNSAPKELQFIPNVSKPEGITETTDALETQLTLAEGIKQAFTDGASAMASAGATALSVFKEANSVLEQYINAIVRSITQTILLAAATKFITNPILGFLGLYTGGSVTNVSGRPVKKAATGLSNFTVPYGSKFLNDGLAVRVGAGETVNVTTASQTRRNESESAIGTSYLRAMANRLDMMYLQSLQDSVSGKSKLDVGVYGRFDGRDLYLSNKKNERISKRIS